jgi:hypothetical protein
MALDESLSTNACKKGLGDLIYRNLFGIDKDLCSGNIYVS